MRTLDNLRKAAKRWLKALRARNEEARARLMRAYPKAPADPSLRDVQHALALEHGLASWGALKDALRDHALANPPTNLGQADHAERVALFLKNACPDWRGGGGPHYALAVHTGMRILRRHPEVARDSLYTAVACGDLEEIERILAERPQAASEKGGPKGWPPLLYLCCTRLPLPAVSDNAVAVARALLDRGADPNAYFPGGSPSIHYTALTCVIGEGEEDAPRHPQFEALTRLLLERGAEPYDEQVLYNTHFHGDILWLMELMYAHSVKAGRKADWDDPEWPMLNMGGYGLGARYLLTIAIRKNDLELAEWLLKHGASPNAAPAPGRNQSKRSLHEEAVRMGQTEMAELLVRYGAPPSAVALEGEEAFAAACFQLDREKAKALLEEHPEYLRSPVAMFAAAKRDRADVVALLLDLGMSPDIEDRQRQRALHVAAYDDAPRVAALLIERGAAVDPVDAMHDGTPLWFAMWGKKPRTIALLSRFSRDVWALSFTGNVERLREVLSAEPGLARLVGDESTPLMWLPDDEARAMEIVKLFLAHGADPSIRDKKGQTAADRARKRGMDDVAEPLDSTGSTSAAPTPAHPSLEPFEQLAKDILDAYRSGDAGAIQRIQDFFKRTVTLYEIRNGVRQRLHKPKDADISLADAQDVVAGLRGFESWTTFAESVTRPGDGAKSWALPLYRIDDRDNKLQVRHSLDEKEWDTIIAVMAERKIPGLDANGQMTDAVIERIVQLDHVIRLELGGSKKLTDAGLRHLARLPRLQHLDLSGTGITDRGLTVLRELAGLTTFRLDHEGVSDAGLTHLADCHRLERVALFPGAGAGTLKALTGKPHLRNLTAGKAFTEADLALLHEFPVFKTWQGGEIRFALMDFEAEPNYLIMHPATPYTKRGLAHLVGLDGLFALNLDNPVAKDADLEPLMQLPNLGWLGHDADDESMRQIGALPRLRMLMAQDTVAGDEGFIALSRSATLEYIWGRRCHNLTGRGFAALSTMPSLRGLSVSCKNVDDAALSTLPRFPALREFMPMDVPDAGFRHVGRCEELEALWCMYCRDTTDAATEHIAVLSRLKTYYAGQTLITDRSLEILSRMPSLEKLEFWNCAGITNAGVAFLAVLPRLREVTLDSCRQVTPEAAAVFPAHVRVTYST